MKEQREDRGAAVQISSTVIPLCKVAEDEIPLVECALMPSGGGSFQRRDMPVKQPHAARPVRIQEAPEIALCSARTPGMVRGCHARYVAGQRRGDETRLPPQIHEEGENIQSYHSQPEGASDAFRCESQVRIHQQLEE